MIWPVSFLFFIIPKRALTTEPLRIKNYVRPIIAAFLSRNLLTFKRKTIAFILLLYRYSSILARLYYIHKFPTTVRWRRRWVVWIGGWEGGQATKWWKYVIDFKRLLQPTFTVLDAIYAYRYVLYPRVRVRATHDVATQIGRRKFTVFPVKSADQSRLTIIVK